MSKQHENSCVMNIKQPWMMWQTARCQQITILQNPPSAQLSSEYNNIPFNPSGIQKSACESGKCGPCRIAASPSGDSCHPFLAPFWASADCSFAGCSASELSAACVQAKQCIHYPHNCRLQEWALKANSPWESYPPALSGDNHTSLPACLLNLVIKGMDHSLAEMVATTELHAVSALITPCRSQDYRKVSASFRRMKLLSAAGV